MIDIMLKNHPQPYAFISKDSLDKLINIQYSKITDTITVGGFSWICDAVVAAINCNHTALFLPEEFDEIPISKHFPIKAKYVGSKLYIVDAKNNSNKLAEGTEILTINGVDVERLQKEIFQY